LFQRSLAAAPDRLHFAAHSHHLWPDASYVGQMAAWQDAARLADRKWDRVMGELWPAAQAHVAAELNLPDPSSIVFAGNTHDFLIRLFASVDRGTRHRPVRLLASDGEFHSFRRQAARWVEAGEAVLETVPAGPGTAERLIAAAAEFEPDLILASHVQFGSGHIVEGLEGLAALADPAGPWVVIDGYHGFMAIDTDLSAISDRVFYLAGGYKYAMAGEGVAMMHCPPGFVPRPVQTGWYAEFDDLSLPPGMIGYATDSGRFMGATFDPSGLYRFVAVRDMLADEGLDTATITIHVAALRDALLAHISSTPLASAALLNPSAPNAIAARFLAFQSPDAARWQAELAKMDVITDVRQNVLRIGFGLYQTLRDVDALSDCLASL
jgi:selenocysteine lyase/cysteine desulfurase